MASKRKQDEKHLNLLRGMVKLEYNKQCFDCNQKGPTYVDMAVGAFVCTSCSGLLRGLNPPHRVKSISMASFTPEEIEFIRARGNHFCQKVWLGLYNRSHFDFDNKDENKLKDFMVQKYEKKRYYVAPTEQMHEEARKFNTPAKSEPATRPLRSMGQVPKLAQNNIIVNQNKPPPQVPKPVSVPLPVSQPAQTAQPPRVDLLSDFGGDPFQSQKPAAAQPQGGFANFEAFGGIPSQQNQPAVPAQPQPTAFPPSGILTPMNSQSGAQPPASQPQQSLFGAFPTSSIAPSGGGDRYSALAELDSEFGKPPSTAPPVSVQWNSAAAGTGGGSIMWGGGATVNSQSSSNTSLLSTSPAMSSNPANFNAVANPFGGGPAASQPSQPNPFAAAPGFNQPPTGYNQTGAGFTQAGYGQQGFIQSPSGPGGGFGAPQMGAQGQFGIPNGASGAPQGWGQPAPQGQMGQFGSFPSNSMMQGGAGAFGQKAVSPQGGAATFGMVPQQQQGFGSWGAGQPTANPFMNIANQAPPARATNSTNPFL